MKKILLIVCGSWLVIGAIVVVNVMLSHYGSQTIPNGIAWLTIISVLALVLSGIVLLWFGMVEIYEPDFIQIKKKMKRKKSTRKDREMDDVYWKAEIRFEIDNIQDTQKLIIKRLEALPMPKSKFAIKQQVIYRPKAYNNQARLCVISGKMDWTLRYKITTTLPNEETIRAYEDELTSLEDYAKEKSTKTV